MTRFNFSFNSIICLSCISAWFFKKINFALWNWTSSKIETSLLFSFNVGNNNIIADDRDDEERVFRLFLDTGLFRVTFSGKRGSGRGRGGSRIWTGTQQLVTKCVSIVSPCRRAPCRILQQHGPSCSDHSETW